MLDEPTPRWRAASAVGRVRPVTRRRRWGRGTLVWVLGIGALLPCWTAAPAGAATRTVELAPVAMTYTDRLWPVRSFADRGQLSLSHTRYTTYLAYDLAEVRADRRVVSAELVLHVDRSDVDDRGLLARYTSPDWSPEALSALQGPAAVSSVVSGQEDVAPRSGSEVTLPLLTTSGIHPQGRVGLQLGLARALEEVQLSKARPPTLRLVVERKSREDQPGRSPLPYAVAPIADSPKKVYAHYLPPYPISIDNEDPREDYYSRNYLAPEGEGGKFRSVGGLLRDRPVPRPPIPEDYELVDATTEVGQAAAAGIDGFTVDLLDWSGPLWDRSLLLAKAADRDDQGFVVVPNLDLASDADDAPVSYIADRLAEFFRSPAAERLPDGRYVLSSFKAEARPPGWWQSIMAELAQRHGIKVALISVLLDASQPNLEAFAPISYALSTWGVRSSTSVLDAPDRASFAHRAGVKWMAPVAVQDVRHHTLVYAEAGNTETLRASWSRVVSDAGRPRPADHLERLQRVDPVRPVAGARQQLPRHQRLLPHPVQDRSGAAAGRRRDRGDPPDPEVRDAAHRPAEPDVPDPVRRQRQAARHRRGAGHARGPRHHHDPGGVGHLDLLGARRPVEHGRAPAAGQGRGQRRAGRAGGGRGHLAVRGGGPADPPGSAVLRGLLAPGVSAPLPDARRAPWGRLGQLKVSTSCGRPATSACWRDSNAMPSADGPEIAIEACWPSRGLSAATESVLE